MRPAPLLPYSANAILLVEDNVNDIELARVAFDLNGFHGEPAVALDGQAALDYLLSQGEFEGRPPGLPRLVLLDLHMPCLSGFDVLRAVKQHEDLRHIPIVVLTTSNLEKDREACLCLGAADYQIKPHRVDAFSTLLSDLASRWLNAPHTHQK